MKVRLRIFLKSQFKLKIHNLDFFCLSAWNGQDGRCCFHLVCPSVRSFEPDIFRMFLGMSSLTKGQRSKVRVTADTLV